MSAELVHRLGIVLSALGAVLCVAVAVSEARRERAARRRAALLTATDALGGPAAGARGTPRHWWRRHVRARQGAEAVRDWLPAVGAVLAGVILVEGLPGCALGLAAAYGTRRWQRGHREADGPDTPDGQPGRGGRRGQAEETEAARQLPLAADLLAACLAAGAGPRQAAEAVGTSLGGPVGERLARAAAELRLGGEPADAWRRVGALPGARELAVCMERSGTTGAPAVDQVSRVAADCRAQQGRSAAERARRAVVLATAPLGLCFLPAFLLIGVVPVMVGMGNGLMTAD